MRLKSEKKIYEGLGEGLGCLAPSQHYFKHLASGITEEEVCSSSLNSCATLITVSSLGEGMHCLCGYNTEGHASGSRTTRYRCGWLLMYSTRVCSTTRLGRLAERGTVRLHFPHYLAVN